MAGKIIWYVTTLGCGILFFSIGIYARKLEKPMWFWSGSTVDPSELTDVKKYNRANGIMWQVYSLLYILAAFLELWSMTAGTILLTASCTVGAFVLVFVYNKIYKKYKVHQTPNV